MNRQKLTLCVLAAVAAGCAFADNRGGAHPLYHLHANVLGVRPSAPFFARVRIAPQPGPLTWIKAKTPHPRGMIVSDLRFDGSSVTGSVRLPAGLTGVFAFAGQEVELASGETAIRMRGQGADPKAK